MIFRIDDVTKNTDLDDLNLTLCHLNEKYPEACILLGVTLFCKSNQGGSVYPKPPFKHRPSAWFYNVDHFSNTHLPDLLSWPNVEICSHGLWHINHATASEELQRASIVTSSTFLGTTTFIPPFNSYSSVTERICMEHNINLCHKEGWKSLEFNDFDNKHGKWYFHAWRVRSKQIERIIQ